MRFTIPMEVVIQHGDDVLDNVPVFLNQVYLPGQHNSATSGLLRAFLEGAGALTPKS